MLTTGEAWARPTKHGGLALVDPAKLDVIARVSLRASWVDATMIGPAMTAGLLHAPEEGALGIVSWQGETRRRGEKGRPSAK